MSGRISAFILVATFGYVYVNPGGFNVRVSVPSGLYGSPRLKFSLRQQKKRGDARSLGRLPTLREDPDADVKSRLAELVQVKLTPRRNLGTGVGGIPKPHPGGVSDGDLPE